MPKWFSRPQGRVAYRFQFDITGPPRPKLRGLPFAFMRGKRPIASIKNNPENEAIEGFIQCRFDEYVVQDERLQELIVEPWRGPVMLRVVNLFPKERTAWFPGRDYIKKPDYDNLSKIVGDALNGHCWADDSQVIQEMSEKYYSDNPRTIVGIVLYERTDK